ncbi:MAG: hypothetical protein JWM89_3998 [Acidimicrobiales bacterium]|nr:hypothetical protein [Acidimicrobiales bacterium]
MRLPNWMRRGVAKALVVALTLAMMAIAPAGAGAQDGSGLTVTCPCTHVADGYDQRQVGPLATGAEGPATDYQTAGATVSFEPHFDGGHGYLVMIVTYKGVARRLSTDGHDFGSYYKVRSPGPGDTEYGYVAITISDRTWVTLFRADSGQVTGFAWLIGGPCSPAPAPTSPASAPAATPASGTSTFTG